MPQNNANEIEIAGTVMTGSPGDVFWQRWKNLEHWLTNIYRVNWIFHEKFPLSDINVPASRKNMARLELPLDKDRVAGNLQLNESIPLYQPALLCYRPKPGALVILCDGNHRDEFNRIKKLTTCAMYEIVGAGPMTIQAITKAANVLVGQGHKPEVMMEHAVDFWRLPENRHFSLDEVVEKFTVKKSTLSRRMKVKEYRDRFGAGGDLPVPGHERLSDTALSHLSVLHKNETVLHTLAKGLVALPVKKLDCREVLAIVDDVKRVTKGQPQMLEVVEKGLARIRQQIEAGGHGHGAGRKSRSMEDRVMSETARFITNLNLAFGTGSSGKDVVKKPEYRSTLVDRIDEIKKTLTRVKKELLA